MERHHKKSFYLYIIETHGGKIVEIIPTSLYKNHLILLCYSRMKNKTTHFKLNSQR